MTNKLIIKQFPSKTRVQQMFQKMVLTNKVFDVIHVYFGGDDLLT